MKFLPLVRNFLYLFLLTVCLPMSQQVSYALSPGQDLPDINEHTLIKPGSTAPRLDLTDTEDNPVHLDFSGKPTVLVAVDSSWISADEMMKWQRMYDRYKQDLNFYLVAPVTPDKERLQTIMRRRNLNMPLLLDEKRRFLRNYNKDTPALLITDKTGVVVYNGESAVDTKSLHRLLDKLLKDGRDHLPALQYCPQPQVFSKPQPPPPFLNHGSIRQHETFGTESGHDVAVTYSGKPTVLLFWGDFNRDPLPAALPIFQQAYAAAADKANFYTINCSGDDMDAGILDEYHCTAPALMDKYHVCFAYVRRFPGIVIVDKNGVVRYRPESPSTPQALEQLIAACDTPYVAAPEPKTAEAWVKHGDQLYQDKNCYYTEAIDAYSQAIKLNPHEYDAYARRATVYHEQEQNEKALLDIDTMFRLRLPVLDAYYLRARVLTNRGKLDLALADYDKILAQKPDDQQASFERANIYMQQFKLDAAITAYSKIIDRAPTAMAAEIYLNRGCCYEFLHNNTAVIADYSRALELNPLSDHTWFMRGLVFSGQGDYHHAIADFTRAIAIHPTAQYYGERANCYFQQGNLDLTIADLTNILNTTPDFAYTYFTRGTLFIKKEQYPEAIADFMAEKKQYPNNVDCVFALAQALELNGDKALALKNYKEVMELHSFPPEFLILLSDEQLRKTQERINGDWNSDKEWIKGRSPDKM